MNASRIILHVGAGKTGSSALQAFLAANRDGLVAAGADYPPDRSAPDGYMSGNVRPVLRFVSDRKAPASSLPPEALRAELRPVLEDARADRVILSNEQIYKAGEDKLAVIRDALATVDPSPVVICVFRELVSHAVSVYSQLVRNHRQTRLLPDFLARHEPPFLPSARALKSVFGSDNVRFAVYSPDPAENLRRFLEAAGLEADGWSPPPPTNRSLSAFETGVMRHLNAISNRGELDKSTLQQLVNAMTARPAPDAAEPVETLELDESVWARMAELTEAINAECFPNGAGLPEPLRSVPDRSRPYAELDAGTARLAELLADAWAAQARHQPPPRRAAIHRGLARILRLRTRLGRSFRRA